MNKHLPPPADATELRHRAEKRLKEHRPETGTAPTEADTQRLVQELQVHQIELEMQNEELQKARADMEAGLEKFSDLYDFAPVGYLTLDRDGAILEANLASSTLLGIERARLVKQRLQSSLSTADRLVFAAFLTRVFEGKGRESCELTLLPEGHPPVVVRMDAAAAAAGRECRAVLADITEHKRAEADRLILNKLESTGILAGGIAHDFNNLLTVILLHIDLAQIHVPCDEEVVGHLTLAAKAGWMARHLTNQLITFSSGGAPVRKLTCLSGVIQAFGRSALMGSQVQCDLSLPEDLWPAEVDAGQIGQVIQNMVLNAREAMPEGGVVSVRAENVVLGAHETSSLPPGEYVQVSITDQGGGIAKEVLPKIFDPYFSTKQRGTQKGMGLGLTICHTVIKKHGGAIAVDAKLGVGTTFRILLPASRKCLPSEESPAPVSPSRPGRILVMDDEPAMRLAVGALLQRMGHEVDLVEDGRKAVETYESAKTQGRPFDVVILDLTVRGGVGAMNAIQALAQIDPSVKAIVMSGYANDPVLLEPGRYGFKGALAKPFDLDSLRRVLTQVMGPGRPAARNQ